jgi:hypothetical protein
MIYTRAKKMVFYYGERPHIFGNEHSFGNLTIGSIGPKYKVEKYRKEVLSRVSAEL